MEKQPVQKSSRQKIESFWDHHYWIYDFTWAIAQRNSYRKLAEETHQWDGLTVLEVGCGKGHLARRVSNRNQYHLIDFSPKMVAATQEVCRKNQLTHIKSVEEQSVLQLTYPDQTFDRTLCAHVLTVVPDLERAAQEIHRTLKTGGQLLVSSSYSLLKGAPADWLNRITRKMGWFYSRDIEAVLLRNGFRYERTLFRGFYEIKQYTKIA